MDVVQRGLIGANLVGGIKLRLKSVGEDGVEDYASGDGAAGTEDAEKGVSEVFPGAAAFVAGVVSLTLGFVEFWGLGGMDAGMAWKSVGGTLWQTREGREREAWVIGTFKSLEFSEAGLDGRVG